MVDKEKQIRLALRANKKGLTITNLTDETNLTRSQVRDGINFLKGAGELEEIKIGMAKLYTLK